MIFIMTKHLLILIILNNVIHFCISTPLEESDHQCLNNITIISRATWNAVEPNYVVYQTFPVKYVIINHTVTQKCSTITKCSKILNNIQDYHMNTRKWDDIGYNFLIGNDGNVYEGVGWHKVGTHTPKYNNRSLGIAFIGDFSEELPSESALDAAKNFLDCAINLNELFITYKLYAARQLKRTLSPGAKLYQEIQNWTHWATPE